MDTTDATDVTGATGTTGTTSTSTSTSTGTGTGTDTNTSGIAAEGRAVAVTAANATRYPVAPGYRLNVRSGPGTQYPLVRSLPLNATVAISCQKYGETVTGPYGTTNIWDSIAPGSTSPTPTCTRAATASWHRAAPDLPGRRPGIIDPVSDDEQTPRTADGATDDAAAGKTGGTTGTTTGGPRPEEIRFFGTTWVDHTGHYGLRRAGLAVGALAAAVAACLVLRFAFQGLLIANTGGIVNGLVVVMFAVCSAIACRKTWRASGAARTTRPARTPCAASRRSASSARSSPTVPAA